MVNKYTVGFTPDAPAVNTNYMFADFLQTCVVDFLVINDVPITFNYVQSTSEKKLTTPGYTFGYNDQLLISFTPFCPIVNQCTPQP